MIAKTFHSVFQKSEVMDFATTLECDGESVRRMSRVDDSGNMAGGNDLQKCGPISVGVPGSNMEDGVCLSVDICVNSTGAVI